MQIMVLTALATLCVVWIVVGTKILLVARRSRGYAEFSLGLSFFLMGGIGVPLNAAGRLLASVEVAQVLAVISSAFSVAGLVLLFSFTAHVFHRGRRWAQVVLVLVVAVGLYYVVGHGIERLASETREEALAAQLRWTLFAVVGALLAFAWAGVSAFGHWWKLRKRVAFGLADPIVVNRMLLWSLFGLISVATTVTAGLLFYSGNAIARDLIQPTTTSLGGLADSVILLLAFAPPKAYLEAVRRRAAAGASA
ncbi:MAG: hypothetical protein MJE66_06195 [Proteobacteria bacterium]|nr:hypothetical protein [Pseudomonadota bacterium]